MTKKILFKNVRLVNEDRVQDGDLLVAGERIEKIATEIFASDADVIVEGAGRLLLPGMIDDQVHFREPGLTHKGEIATESAAAVAGGITSYMEMPNTIPTATDIDTLEAKYTRAAEVSRANYSFYMGASNDNLEEVKRVDPQKICGVKIFMGASTGNMLVDNPATLEGIFRDSPTLVATHCEDTPTILRQEELFRKKYGEKVPFRFHGEIRSEEACWLSSSLAVSLAKRFDTRLHVLHLTTEKEMQHFSPGPLPGKKITAEVCVHHLWFEEGDYERLGAKIKWNPSIKKKSDRAALRKALLEDRIDVIATDNAPHTLEEKAMPYFQAPSGGPLVQHALPALFELVAEGVFDLPMLVRKTCHAPADCYLLADRGYLREGFFADLVLVDPSKSWVVSPSNILYKCGWSPFEGVEFSASIAGTWVNGSQVWDGSQLVGSPMGQRLIFDR